MALKDDLKSSGDEIKRLNDLGTEFSAIYRDISQALKGLSRDSKDFGSGIKDAAQLSANLAKSAQELAGFTKEDLKDRKKANEFSKKAEDLAKVRQKLESQIRVFRSQTVNATKAEQVILNKVNENLSNASEYTKDISDSFNEILDTSKKIEKTDPFGKFSDFVAEIPVLRKVFPEFQNASKVFRDNFAETGNYAKSLGKSIFTASGALSKIAALEVLRRGVEEVDLLQQRVVGFRRELGLSLEEASQLQVNMSEAALSSGKLFFNSERYAEAQKNINDLMGTNATISSDMAENYSALVYRLGLSNEEATKLNLTSIVARKNAKDFTAETKTRVLLLNGENKLQISERAVLKDISQTSSRIQLSLREQGKSLVEAVYSSKKLGLNLGQVEKVADSLLNFEESISSELEAELLTGQDLNLERARTLALNNDLAGVAEEITKQGITSEKFGRMNRIQQEAIAKALGLNANELADSLVFQEEAAALAKSSGYRDAKSLEDLKEKVKLRAKMKDAAGKEIGYEKALSEIGSQKLKAQLDAATAQEQLAEKQKQAADVMIKAMGADGLPKVMNTLNASIEGLTDAIVALSMIQGLSSVANLSKTALGPGGMLGPGGVKGMFKGVPGGSRAGNVLRGGAKLGGAIVGAAALAQTGKGIYDFASEKSLRDTGVGGFFESLGGTGMHILDTLTFGGTKAIGNAAGWSIEGMGTDDVASARAIFHASGRDPDDSRFPIDTDNQQLITDIINNPMAYPQGIVNQAMGTDVGRRLSAQQSGGNITELAVGGITKGPTNALIGEAGPEAVVPLNEFYAKLDQLIAATKEGKNIYMDYEKVATVGKINSYKSDY
jgi:hypothetical protein